MSRVYICCERGKFNQKNPSDHILVCQPGLIINLEDLLILVLVSVTTLQNKKVF